MAKEYSLKSDAQIGREIGRKVMGGEGSGYFGHSGRPGEVGGSGEGEGGGGGKIPTLGRKPFRGVGTEAEPFVDRLKGTRVVKWWQDEGGMLRGEIRDKFGDMVSATTAKSSAELHKWIEEHDIARVGRTSTVWG